MKETPHIAYYISSHGFGHAVRQKAVIRLLSQAGIHVHVRTGAPPKFFHFPRVTYHQERYDIGLVQPDALHIDARASFEWYARFLAEQRALVERETTFVREQDIRLVVSDMPPIACEIAHQAGIPSVVMTHFTWDWIYEYYLDALPEYQFVVDAIRAQYGKTTLALQMPFAHEFTMFPVVEPMPLVVNEVTQSPDEVRKQFDVPDGRSVALLSMGGMNWENDRAGAMREKMDWIFLIPDDMKPSLGELHNARWIPTDYADYQNIFALVDVVIGKAGGSTVAECVAKGTNMLYTLRDDYRENILLHKALQTYTNSMLVEKYEFESGAWLSMLDYIAEQKSPKPQVAGNGAYVASERIMQMLNEG